MLMNIVKKTKEKRNRYMKEKRNRQFINSIKEGNLYKIRKVLEKGEVDLNIKCNYAFIYACAKGYTNIVRFLLEKGVDPNVENGKGLLLACAKGNLSIVKLLIIYRVDIHTPDIEGNPDGALTYAYINNNYHIVQYLLKFYSSKKIKFFNLMKFKMNIER